MARDALVELLARMRRSVSIEELRASVPQIHHELAEIQRKRSHFLEDACAAVLKQSFPTPHDSDSDSELEETESGLLLESLGVCTVFAEPLVRGLPPQAVDEDVDVTRQRGVLVAFLLSVLGRPELTLDDTENAQQGRLLAALVVTCGIDHLTIAWTLRFREELHMFRDMMVPRNGDEAESDPDDGVDDEDDEDDESDGEDDDAWIVRTAAAEVGLHSPFDYFMKETRQEYAFASWSSVGIVRLAVLLGDTSNLATSLGESTVLSINTPCSHLFAMGAVAQALLQAQTIQTKRQGLSVLKQALDKCSPGSLTLGDVNVSRDVTTTQNNSFAEAAAAFRQRDWITSLVELVSNAMVSFPEANDRALGLTIFRQLLQVVEINDRFRLMQRLALRCPYGNVAAILVDQVRNDTFRVWSNMRDVCKSTAFTSAELTTLIVELLKLLVERDLKLHADLLASVASLIRFVAIRDKENRTGFRTPDTIEVVKDLLNRLHSRLRSTISEIQPSTSLTNPSDLHAMLHDENSRFVLVEAALQSTISLLSV